MKALNPTDLMDLTFEKPDLPTFQCLDLAYHVGRIGGTAPCALNAANEIAVGAFLLGACGFLDIPATIASVLEAHGASPVESVEHLEDVDAWARGMARSILKI